jgi:hypothetical protein
MVQEDEGRVWLDQNSAQDPHTNEMPVAGYTPCTVEISCLHTVVVIASPAGIFTRNRYLQSLLGVMKQGKQNAQLLGSNSFNISRPFQ